MMTKQIKGARHRRGVTLEMVVRKGPCEGVTSDKDLNEERKTI